MDEIDIRLLHMLNQGLEINEISKKLGLTRQSIYYRIKKLKETIELKQTISANLEKIGINTMVLVLIKWNLEKLDERTEFVDKIINNPHVGLTFPILGSWDYCLIVIAKSMREYSDFVTWAYKEGKGCLEKWESYPITKFRKGNIELQDIQGLLSKPSD